MSLRLDPPAVLSAIALSLGGALVAIMLDPWSPDTAFPVTSGSPKTAVVPPTILPIATVPVGTRLATAYDEYGTYGRMELRTAFVELGRANPAEAIALLAARIETETRPHLMLDLPELAIRTGGQAALALITTYGDRGDLDFATRTAMIEAIARARLADAVMLLVDWQERPAYAKHSTLLRDAAVSLGTAVDAVALGERATREIDAPRQARLLAFKRAIEDKLRQHALSAQLHELDATALIRELSLAESPWSRVHVVQRLEHLATVDAIRALGDAAARHARDDVRINAWAALLRLSSHDTHARKVAFDTLASVDGARRETMCPVFVHYADAGLVSELAVYAKPIADATVKARLDALVRAATTHLASRPPAGGAGSGPPSK